MKKIGIGYEFYKDFIDQDLYYVDKTMLVRDILKKGGQVTLITRPRRFGKTLALTMLQTYFELEYDYDGNVIDKRRYFEGKKIMEAGDEVLSKMGQYPVIRLSLKSAKQPRFYSAIMKLREDITREFKRHSYLRTSSELDEDSRNSFISLSDGFTLWNEKEQNFKNREEEKAEFEKECNKYATSIRTLSECLKLHHKKNVIILIDEYDVPLENSWFSGFYDKMVGFIRSLFESSLKTNTALEFAVVTGCLRISKESIFTGLNNLRVNSIRGKEFGEYFGFTQEETEQMLIDYDLKGNIDIVKDWYDGYLFGESEVYNPWSVTTYVSEHLGAPERFAEPYWSNTSSNSIIKDLVDQANDETKQELELLISGGTIEKPIHEDITYGDVYKSQDNLWNFLFFTGYMKKTSERQENTVVYLTMKIPNKEILYIYENQVREWFNTELKKEDRSILHKAVLKRDTNAMSRILTGFLKKSISTFDSQESFYHGFLLSMLIGINDYSARSNREEGTGRPDIVLYPGWPADPAYIFEIKIRKKYNQMQDGLKEAFDQITEQKYEEGILDDGYAGVISFGVCFCKKSCIIAELPGKPDK